MTPCTTQSSFDSAMPMASPRHKNNIHFEEAFGPTFDVGHATMVETHMALLIIAHNCCFHQRNMREQTDRNTESQNTLLYTS